MHEKILILKAYCSCNKRAPFGTRNCGFGSSVYTLANPMRQATQIHLRIRAEHLACQCSESKGVTIMKSRSKKKVSNSYAIKAVVTHKLCFFDDLCPFRLVCRLLVGCLNSL